MQSYFALISARINNAQIIMTYDNNYVQASSDLGYIESSVNTCEKRISMGTT